jgi:hypothetical protein
MFHIKWAPILTAAQLIGASNPQTPGQPEAMPWFLYDTQPFTTAVTTSAQFFQTVQGDKTLGNMESAGQLPDPQYFILHYVTCDILDPPTASALLTGQALGPVADIDAILKSQRATFQLTISNKVYGPFPLTLCHATGGATGNGTATQAAPLSMWYGNNGIVGSGGFPFLGSIVLPPKVGFTLSVNLAAAATLNTSPLNIRMGMAGVLYRRVV